MVLGEGTRESEAPGKRPAETAKKVTENAVLAKTVHPATLRPIKTFKIQPEGGEGKKVPSGSSHRPEAADLFFQCKRPVDTSLFLKAHTLSPTHLPLLSPEGVRPARRKKGGAVGPNSAPQLQGKNQGVESQAGNWPRKWDQTKT